VNSPTLKQSVVSLDRALKSVDTLSNTLNSEIPPLSANLKETSLAVKDAFRSADRLITENEKKVDDIVTNVRDTIKTIQTAVQRAEDTLRTLEGMARRNENLGFEVQTALDEFSATSRSLRILTDYIEQHPEAFVRGKRSR
jgi:paraquat-inducible protein B